MAISEVNDKSWEWIKYLSYFQRLPGSREGSPTWEFHRAGYATRIAQLCSQRETVFLLTVCHHVPASLHPNIKWGPCSLSVPVWWNFYVSLKDHEASKGQFSICAAIPNKVWVLTSAYRIRHISCQHLFRPLILYLLTHSVTFKNLYVCVYHIHLCVSCPHAYGFPWRSGERVR